MAGKGGGEQEQRMEAAAGWVARLQSGDATEQDRRAFQDWLAQDEANGPAYEEMKSLWSDLRDVPIPKDRLKKLRVSRRTAIGNAVALVLIAALATTLYRMGLVDRLRADHYTAVGEVAHLTLEDGSRVDLNTDSAITVRYTPEERRIELLRGEAFFEVTKNPERPFIVEDQALQAKVLGTKFAVRMASGTLPADVQVEEGRVEVSHRGDSLVLGPGDTARVAEGGRLSVERSDVANETAWRDGKLVFSGQPLQDVLAILGRYRQGRIMVLDTAAANQRVSGIFDLDDTDQALAVLEQSLPVSITRLSGWIVLVRSR